MKNSPIKMRISKELQEIIEDERKAKEFLAEIYKKELWKALKQEEDKILNNELKGAL